MAALTPAEKIIVLVYFHKINSKLKLLQALSGITADTYKMLGPHFDNLAYRSVLVK